MLARRDLSEAQVRERLARRGHDPAEIDEAVARLTAERAIDDVRTAEAIARTQAGVKRRGRRRVAHELARAGIAPAVARAALDRIYEGLDQEALVEDALARRMRGRAAVGDEGEMRRLYRYLVAQGFDPEHARRALERRRARPRD
jgi:regulatory protein